MYGDGKRHFYPRTDSIRTIDTETILNSREFGHVGELGFAVSALVQRMSKYLSMGHSVKIDGLGIFSPVLAFDEKGIGTVEQGSNEQVEKAFNYKPVSMDTVSFRIDPAWRQNLRELTRCEKVGFNYETRSERTFEERVALTRDYVREQGFITVAGYARLHDLKWSTAQKEMDMLKRNPEYGFRVGPSRHMVLGTMNSEE
jgi:hypothetical protein